MTRTARSLHPRAMVRDRSESKSGHDKHIRKDGGGPHGWGRLTDEKDLESAAMEDEQLEFNEENNVQSREIEKPGMMQRTVSVSSTSSEELESARKFRKNALKGQGIDLAAIARTSAAVSTSPVSPSMTRSISLGHGTNTLVSV